MSDVMARRVSSIISDFENPQNYACLKSHRVRRHMGPSSSRSSRTLVLIMIMTPTHSKSQNDIVCRQTSSVTLRKKGGSSMPPPLI